MERSDRVLLEATAMAALACLGGLHVMNQTAAANEAVAESMRAESARGAELSGRLIDALQFAIGGDVVRAESALADLFKFVKPPA